MNKNIQTKNGCMNTLAESYGQDVVLEKDGKIEIPIKYTNKIKDMKTT